MDLGHFHTTVFLTPAVISLFADTKVTGSFDDSLALRDQDLRLSEMTDDLFCRITLSCHDDPFLNTHILTLGLGTIQGGRSTGRSSVQVAVDVEAERADGTGTVLVTEARAVYVAVDGDGRSVPLGREE